MPEGWKLSLSPFYNEACRERRGSDVTVTVDGDGITTEERTYGYYGGTATVHVPLAVLRALLATQGYVVERECPEHGRACWDARCDVREPPSQSGQQIAGSTPDQPENKPDSR